MSKFSFLAIDHVQLAMPPGEESTARHFYADLLGIGGDSQARAVGPARRLLVC
jgi:4-hydroxyphenylpyruvate dioxygenase-like putative hemolysin